MNESSQTVPEGHKFHHLNMEKLSQWFLIFWGHTTEKLVKFVSLVQKKCADTLRRTILYVFRDLGIL